MTLKCGYGKWNVENAGDYPQGTDADAAVSHRHVGRLNMSDVIDEAQQCLNIDWTQEPRSDRERKIRAALLRKRLQEVDKWPLSARGSLQVLVGYEPETYASDARQAWDVVKAATEHWIHARKLREIEEAIREADAS
jgi:hypothetical protein